MLYNFFPGLCQSLDDPCRAEKSLQPRTMLPQNRHERVFVEQLRISMNKQTNEQMN